MILRRLLLSIFLVAIGALAIVWFVLVLILTLIFALPMLPLIVCVILSKRLTV